MENRYEACYLRKQWVAAVPVLNKESEGAYSVGRLVFLTTTKLRPSPKVELYLVWD